MRRLLALLALLGFAAATPATAAEDLQSLVTRLAKIGSFDGGAGEPRMRVETPLPTSIRSPGPLTSGRLQTTGDADGPAVSRINGIDLAALRRPDHCGLARTSIPVGPWNPLIAGVFYRRGIIESWGRGTIKMAELALSAGLPRPEIEEVGGGVTVRFLPTRYVPPQRVARALTERQRLILALLAASPAGLALRDIRAGLGEAPAEWEVKDDLALLKRLELVETRGRGRGSFWEIL